MEKKELIETNPTDHVFNIPIDKLRQTIIESFNELKTMHSEFYDSSVFFYEFKGYRHQAIFRAETSPGIFGRQYFEQEGTKDDIYLYSHEYWISPIYKAGGKQLNCRTAFILTLTKIDDENTLLKVKPEDLKVIKGVEGFTAHGFYSKEISVDPTTIEEYSLIYFIAEQLGDKTLRPLNLLTKD